MSEALVAGLDLLRYFAKRRRPLTIREAAEGAGLKRATTYRMVDDLQRSGWLTVHPDQSPRRYSLSWEVRRLGLLALKSYIPYESVLPHLIALARRTRRPCVLGFYDDGDVVITDEVEVMDERTMPIVRGDRYRCSSTACGRVLLAYQTDTEIQRVASQGSPKFTEATRTDPDEILNDLMVVRANGWAVANGEYVAGFGALAAPIFNAAGEVIAGLSVRAHGEVTEGFVKEVLPHVRMQTALASAEFGYRNVRGHSAV